MPNNRVKTVKAIQGKKKNLSSLHPKSRRAKQMGRINARIDRLQKRGTARGKNLSSQMDRLLWFALAMDPDIECLASLADLHDMIGDFLARHTQDLAAENESRRSDRPKSKRQEQLEQDLETEMQEYHQTGFLVPDLLNVESVKDVRHWSNDLNGDPQFKARLRLLRVFDPKNGKGLVLPVHQHIVVVQAGACSTRSTEVPDSMQLDQE